MSEDKEKNLEKSEEPSSEGNNNGGLSLGAILNESMQDGDVFDALAFLDSKPENKKKKQEKQEKTVVSEEPEKNSVVQESVPINTGNTTRPVSNEPKKISEALGLSKPQPPKITTPKKTVAKKVKKPASASKITDGVPISEALKKSISKTGSEPLDIKDIKLTPEEASQPVFVKEPTIAPSAARKTVVKKSPSGSKGAAKKGKLLKVVALLLAFGAVFAVMAKLGFSDVKKQDKNIAEALAINKNTHNDRNVSGGDFANQGYEQNISDWLPKDENASVADSATQWFGGDSEQYQYQYPQGTHWEADLSLGDSDDDYSLNGYVANSSDYDFSSFSDTSYNSGADSYYGGYSGGSSFNFGSSWGGGGGGGSSTSASFSTPSNTSSSSQSNNSDESEVVVQQENPRNTGINAKKKPLIPGGDYTEEEKKKLSVDNKPVLNLQSTSATPAFSNSTDIAKSNFGSSFNQDGDGNGGTHKADPFSEGGKMTMDNTGKGGIGEGSLKDALSSAKGAGGSVSGPEEVPNGVDDDKKGGSGSDGGNSGGGGGGGGGDNSNLNSINSDNTKEESEDKKDDKKTSEENKKEDNKKEEKETDDKNKTTANDKDKEKNTTAKATTCTLNGKEYSVGATGSLSVAQKKVFVQSRDYCEEECFSEDAYYSYKDTSIYYEIADKCELYVIVLGTQKITDLDTEEVKEGRYKDVFLVDPVSGSIKQRVSLQPVKE